MLQSVNGLKGCDIVTTDDEIGNVSDKLRFII